MTACTSWKLSANPAPTVVASAGRLELAVTDQLGSVELTSAIEILQENSMKPKWFEFVDNLDQKPDISDWAIFILVLTFIFLAAYQR
jgi:hypothetical protein